MGDFRKSVDPPVMTRQRVRDAVRLIAAAPQQARGANRTETDRLRRLLDEQERMLIVAALREVVTPSQSWTDIGTELRCAHSSAMKEWERWEAMPWRDRANWLDLVERVVIETERRSVATR